MSIKIARFFESIKKIEDPYKQVELVDNEKDMIESELSDQMRIINNGYMTFIQKSALNVKRAWEIYKEENLDGKVFFVNTLLAVADYGYVLYEDD